MKTPAYNEKVKDAISSLVKRYELDMLILFGSQATGKTHTERDFDIAYYSSKKIDFDQESRLNADLTGILKNDKVSLVNLKMASPLLFKEIMSKGVVLYSQNSSMFSQLYTLALRMYEEAKPLFELRRHYVSNKLNEYRHARS